MTKQQALEYFKENILPAVIKKYGKNDETAIREEWNVYTDTLCKNREITLKQYESWDNPF